MARQKAKTVANTQTTWKRRYMWLLLATIAALLAVWLFGNLIREEPVTVSLYTLHARAIEETVTCTGKIEAAQSQGVYADMACVAKDVLVETGQRVDKGDVLFTVDVDATKQVLATMGGVDASQIPDQTVRGEVTAPIAGIVTALTAVEGNAVDVQKPCVVIAPGESLQVKVSLHERDVPRVQVGQMVRVSGVAFSKSAYSGTVKSISSAARQQYTTGGINETVVDAVVVFQPEEIDESLRLGLTARANVVVAAADDALVVPYEYVREDEQQREYVYVCEGQRAVKRYITTGEELADGFRVLDGLQPGASIVMQPDVIPADGALLRISGEAA